MQIGNYKLTHQVGSGGMGTVFRALDSAGNPVALKMIGSKTAIDATVHVVPGRRVQRPPALDVNWRMMLVREARVAMELNHPNITRVFDYGQHEGLLYIVMEFLNGRPLDKVIPLYGAISLSSRIALVRQLCDALIYAHRQGVIHRDIKPPNCFVVEGTVLKILDFGIAWRARQQPNQALLMGTITHMAPELLTGPPRYAESSDIWAAGVTFYQLLTGRLPFTGSSFSELRNSITQMQFQPLSESHPCARELGIILNRALAKDPASRYAAAHDFARDLRSVEAALHTSSKQREDAQYQNDAPAWWARTVFHETALTSPLPPARSTIAILSREVRVRSRGNSLRFAEFNAKILWPVIAGTLLLLSFAIFSMLGGDGYAPSAWAWAWRSSAYLASFFIPVLWLISALLFCPAVFEKLAGVAWCRRCRAILWHRSRVTAFAYSKVSWRHASSDCLAALKEDLWADAPKLLSMHGELAPPGFEERTSYPPLRLHLDFFSCPCGDEMATITTEDRIGREWNTREEFVGAYKTREAPDPRPSVLESLAAMLGAVARAVRLAAEPIPLRIIGPLVLAGFLIAFVYYWPQYPILNGSEKTQILVQSDPPGHVFHLLQLAPLPSFTTPQIFQEGYHNGEIIMCDDILDDNGKVYRFSGVTPKPYSIDAFPYHVRVHDVTISVDFVKDRWGRLTARPVVPVYTIKYAVIGTRDQMDEAGMKALAGGKTSGNPRNLDPAVSAAKR